MNRLFVASVAASATIVAAVCSLMALVLAGPFAISWVEFAGGSFFFFFGWPVALLLTLIVGVPSWRGLARGKGAPPLPVVAGLAILACAVAVPLVVSGFFGTRNGLLVLVPIGAAAGAVGGLVFWAVARGGARLDAS